MPNPSPATDTAYCAPITIDPGTWTVPVSTQSLDVRLKHIEAKSEFLAVGMTLQLALIVVCVIVTVANTCCFFQHVIGKGSYGHRGA